MARRYDKISHRHEKMPKAAAYFLVAVGLFMGTIFCFMNVWEAPVAKQDAIHVEGIYSSYEVYYGKYSVSDVRIFLQDNDEYLAIDGCCFNDDVERKLENLKPGFPVDLYLHPESGDTIVEMVAPGLVILDFNYAMEQLQDEAWGFTILGILMYAMAAYGLYKILRKEII